MVFDPQKYLAEKDKPVSEQDSGRDYSSSSRQNEKETSRGESYYSPNNNRKAAGSRKGESKSFSKSGKTKGNYRGKTADRQGNGREKSNYQRREDFPRVNRRAVDPIRKLVWQVLCAVEKDDAYANLLLPPRLSRAEITGRDAAFATELTYGTLRQRLYYDRVFEIVSGRDAATQEISVINLMRLGLHQLLNMRVPEHAAVHETVDLAHTVADKGVGSFVNAIMRRTLRYIKEGKLEVNPVSKDPLAGIGLKYSHPAWIVAAYRAAWKRAKGVEPTQQELEEILQANNQAPKVNLVARPGLCSVSELRQEALEAGFSTAVTPLSPYGLILESGDPALLKSVREHRAAVEDQGSQLMATLAATYPLEGRDLYYLDMCAGPGGKTALMAAIAGEDKQVIANEIIPHRAELVAESVQALSNVKVNCEDGRDLALHTLAEKYDLPLGEGFDRVLVDAPCSGLGALRRHPESRYRARNETMPDLTNLQADLLKKALELTRPGGIVVYVTCSPHLAETLTVVRRVEEEYSQCTWVNLNESFWQEKFNGVGLSKDGKYLQLWPSTDGADAMFAAVLMKQG